MAEKAVSAAAPAKINLYLHVTGKRSDGFHSLDSLAVFAGAGDSVTVRPAGALSLTLNGPFAGDLGPGPDNLVLAAARTLAAHAGVTAGAEMILTKRLPVASGMGGGSADAAAALKALRRLWGLKVSDEELSRLGLKLGADVPVCLAGRAAFMAGIGEELSAAPALPPAWLVLVNPGFGVSTPEVFARRRGPFSEAARFKDAPRDAKELAAVLNERSNDLTKAALSLLPVLGDVLGALEKTNGNLLCRMTGSGATCFGLYAEEKTAGEAAAAVSREHPGWWVEATPFGAEAARVGD